MPEGRSSRHLTLELGAGGQRQIEPTGNLSLEEPRHPGWRARPREGGTGGVQSVWERARGSPPPPGAWLEGKSPMGVDWKMKMGEVTGTVSPEERGTEGWQLPGGGRGFQVGG